MGVEEVGLPLCVLKSLPVWWDHPLVPLQRHCAWERDGCQREGMREREREREREKEREKEREIERGVESE